MIQNFEQRHAPSARLCPGFGGSSSSAAATTNTTETRDMRVVGGNDSTNLSANDSNVTVIATDHGAVSAGLQVGSQAIDASTKTSAAALATGENMFTGALASIAESSQTAMGAVSTANERLALAYQSGQAPEQTMLKYAGFAVVGLAAVMLLKKG
jgi:hypothetical protein